MSHQRSILFEAAAERNIMKLNKIFLTPHASTRLRRIYSSSIPPAAINAAVLLHYP